jgi:acetoin utilization deacetylase AcuC-like enzyme
MRELGAPVLVCLEGGYQPSALAASVLATVEALASDREPNRVSIEAAAPYLERQRGRWPTL